MTRERLGVWQYAFPSGSLSHWISRLVIQGPVLGTSGTPAGLPIILISYYVPNTGQLPFFRKLLHTLPPNLGGAVLFGGDSNVALDSIFDKTRRPSFAPRHFPNFGSKLVRMFHYYNLIDIWRELNPSTGLFTIPSPE